MNKLFTPIKIRDLEIPNRVVISPMCTYSAEQGFASDWHLVHIGRFALGGAGLIFVEATAVQEGGGLSQGDIGIWSDDQIAPLKRIADFIKSCGAVPAIQLGHAGRKASSQRPWIGTGALTEEDAAYGDVAWQTVSASPIPVNENWPTPKELTVEEILEMEDDWVAAAKRALKAGFEVVEVHCAHGYLMHQFLSTVSNHRTDEYGGSMENRMRHALSTAKKVRDVWPQHLPVFTRISAVDQDWSIDDSVILAKELKAVGIDVIDCSTGGLGRGGNNFRLNRGYGFQIPYAETIKKEADVMTMAVGLIIDPETANEALIEERADLIAIGRGALEDPNWPLHAKRALDENELPYAGWPKQYGVWLNQRERTLEKIRAGELSKPDNAASR